MNAVVAREQVCRSPSDRRRGTLGGVAHLAAVATERGRYSSPPDRAMRTFCTPAAVVAPRPVRAFCTGRLPAVRPDGMTLRSLVTRYARSIYRTAIVRSDLAART